MIHTEFLAGQGLGNQLWVYAAARGIAEHLGRAHVVTGRDMFKAHDVLELDWGDAEMLKAGPVGHFQEELFFDPELAYFSSDFDARVTALPPRCRVDGLMQSEDYFFGRLDDLGQWIRTTEPIRIRAEDFADRVVLNLRGGEYKRHKHLVLPKTYWQHAMRHLTEKTGETRFLLVTDDPAYARAMFPGYEVVSGIAESWAALYGARALAVSNSSFSYFPIKTRADKPLVIAPMLWARPANAQNRWASPANFYESWQWLSADGILVEPTDCAKIVAATRTHYQSYNIRVPQSLGLGQSKTRHIPEWLKRPLKRAASHLMPTRIG